MLNKIIRYSLNNRLVILMASVLLLIGGSYIAGRMEIDVFPDLTAPTVVVMTEAPGMAAEEVERLITFPIETAINGATNIRRVRSSSTTGYSVVNAEFDWGTNIFVARQIVSEKLAGVGDALPSNAGNPTLAPQSSLMGEVMIMGLTADSTAIEDLRTYADWVIRPRLLSIGGVAQVTVSGGKIREYQILLDPQKMKFYRVSLDEVLEAAREMNAGASGGILNQYGNEYIIKGMTRTTDPGEIGRNVIKIEDGYPVKLEDVAQVTVGTRLPLLGEASVRGVPGVLMSITKQPATNTIELTRRIDEAIVDIQKSLPPDIRMSTDNFRQANFINNSIDNIRKALIEGAIFVIIILFVFLANFRTTVISLLAIPLSLLFSIIVLKMLGMTVNTMSLGGMAIAIGSLVDDAIIDVENVFKRLRQNHLKPEGKQKPKLEVVFEASKEIRASIFNATLIIIVTFIPLFFLSGMEGRMLKPLGISFIVSLFASMIVAITLTPVLCSYLLTGKKMLDKHEKEPWVTRNLKIIYENALIGVMRYKKWAMGIAVGLFVAALIIMTGLGRSFLPKFNEGSMSIAIAVTPGVSLEESSRIGAMAEKMIMSIPEVITVSRKTGRGELDEHALGTNVSELDVPFKLKNRSREEMFAEVRSKLGELKGVVFEIGQPISHRLDMLLSGTSSNVAVKLFGTDLNRMFSVGNQIKNSIQGINGLVDINVEQQVETPQLQIVPRREMLARFGIPVPELNKVIETALAGKTVSQVYDEARVFDLTVKFNEQSRSGMDAIRSILIDAVNADGQAEKIPLYYVADVVSASGPNTINRENVQRKIVVSANVESGDLRGTVNEIRKRIEENVTLPEGYHIEYGGQFESEAAASRVLLITSLISILIVFLLLFHEFRDTRLTGVIMLSLPLALIGGIFSVWLTSGVISIPSIIGFISLFGIATRNGILLISRYNTLKEQGMGLYDRIIKGSIDRLNPIMMTALTSGLALIPLAAGGQLPGNEIQSPMAQVILGGLLTSTLLNIFLIPVVYYLMNAKEEKGSEEKVL